jgi:hypothetical protein
MMMNRFLAESETASPQAIRERLISLGSDSPNFSKFITTSLTLTTFRKGTIKS